jgi:hypothetical protein
MRYNVLLRESGVAIFRTVLFLDAMGDMSLDVHHLPYELERGRILQLGINGAFFPVPLAV